MLYQQAGRVTTAKPLFRLTHKRWKSLLYWNWDTIVASLRSSLTTLQKKAEDMQIVPDFLYVHYLRSSVCNQLPCFRLDFFDENKWNGNTECWVYWDTSAVTDFLYTCIPISIDELAADRGKKEAELERKRLECANELYESMKHMIELLFNETLTKLNFYNKYEVFFGEYMGEAKRIF